MQELFFRYNPWWEGKYQLKNIFPRPKLLNKLRENLDNKQIILLTGLRRVGKTTLLKILIQELIDKQISAKNIFYISLDDYLLKDKTILEIIEEYRKIQKINFKEKVYLFLDEVAYVKDFEQQLKNLYDQQNVKIYASSSSASILKSKKNYLTGRNFIIEILPLDFQEYLSFKQIEISPGDEHLKKSYFEEYMQSGGLPEYVLRSDIEYLKELVDDIISKDIASFYKVKNPQVLKDFFVLLMERAGKKASLNKMAHILGISPDSARRYLRMFSDTYLIYTLPRCGKTNETLLSPQKIYAADLGIRTLFTGFRDKGSLFENYVYLQLKKSQLCYLYQDEAEIDFFVNKDILVEVKYYDEMKDKQKKLWDKTEARKKVVIRDIYELEKFLK